MPSPITLNIFFGFSEHFHLFIMAHTDKHNCYVLNTMPYHSTVKRYTQTHTQENKHQIV